MKFGPKPVESAQCCILAHSVQTPDGRLRKGTRLDTRHVAQLKTAGLTSVIVAELEPGDVDEDMAARHLGAALLSGTQGIRATTAATGRVNLVADAPGVVRIDRDAVDALNAVDPMITLATVPDLHQTHHGGLIGTVKIISYAVPSDHLDTACAHGRGALSVAMPKALTASLIITQIKADNDESKAINVTNARLTALGARLVKTVTVPHTVAELSAALGASGTDITLILTGSATSDPHDVGPSAVREAGGKITRFGMPVDPGNLLFLGELDGKPVLGLPGCARAPALNGADMVLSRLLCGIPVTRADIAGLGVGGLLKEIPTRPRPRLG